MNQPISFFITYKFKNCRHFLTYKWKSGTVWPLTISFKPTNSLAQSRIYISSSGAYTCVPRDVAYATVLPRDFPELSSVDPSSPSCLSFARQRKGQRRGKVYFAWLWNHCSSKIKVCTEFSISSEALCFSLPPQSSEAITFDEVEVNGLSGSGDKRSWTFSRGNFM